MSRLKMKYSEITSDSKASQMFTANTAHRHARLRSHVFLKSKRCCQIRIHKREKHRHGARKKTLRMPNVCVDVSFLSSFQSQILIPIGLMLLELDNNCGCSVVSAIVFVGSWCREGQGCKSLHVPTFQVFPYY